MRYLVTAFSPSMLKSGAGIEARVREITLTEAVALSNGATSAVGHEVTAQILTALLGRQVAFNRVNLTLSAGDELVVVIPNFRANEAREFTKQEVEAAGFRCFWVEV